MHSRPDHASVPSFVATGFDRGPAHSELRGLHSEVGPLGRKVYFLMQIIASQIQITEVDWICLAHVAT